MRLDPNPSPCSQLVDYSDGLWAQGLKHTFERARQELQK